MHDAHHDRSAETEQTGSPDEHTVDTAATQRYLDLVRAANQEWTALEARGEPSVQMSPRALATIKESVRAEVRHGAQVEMPPTDAGPFTTSELALRTLVRAAVDSVPGARALRTAFDYSPEHGPGAGRGTPVRLRCRISASIDSPDLRALADEVRTRVSTRCADELGLEDIAVDIHIEDLHALHR